MTDIDDFSSPHDEADERRAEEPPDGYYDTRPVDLEEVEQRLERLKFLAPPFGVVATRAELNGTEDLNDLAALIGQEVHGMLAELREARQRIAEWEALEKREEWAVTLGGAVPPIGPIQDGEYVEAALDLARKHKGQAWRRLLTVHPWEPIAADAPF